MIIYRDELFGFFEIFNEANGFLFRSDVGGVDPVMRSFPELLDIGIMGHCDSGKYCKAAGIDCYQMGHESSRPHMTVENFQQIINQATGKTFQIALGGAGDPNKHPQFAQILHVCRSYRIVPNLTTSGFLLSDDEIRAIKRYCGAVAISWYSRLIGNKESNQSTIEATNKLVNAGCVTNIHYVVSQDTLEEAIIRLENNLFPSGINAIIFILYKPIGNGVAEKTLNKHDSRLGHFFNLATEAKHPFRIGFDTCFTPAILHWASDTLEFCIDACEAATFSMYIDSQLNCFPCSFGIWDERISESLYEKNIREIWMGEKFSAFRANKKNKCKECNRSQHCLGGCRLGIDIDLCHN